MSPWVSLFEGGVCRDYAVAAAYYLALRGYESGMLVAFDGKGDGYAAAVVRLGDSYYVVDAVGVEPLEEYVAGLLDGWQAIYVELWEGWYMAIISYPLLQLASENPMATVKLLLLARWPKREKRKPKTVEASRHSA